VYTANAIQYVSPNFAGFTAQLEYAPAEVAGYQGTKSLGLKYASGPFGVSLVIDSAKAVNGTAQDRTAQLAGFWDFGVAKLSATYQDANGSSTNDQAYVFGLNVPFGPGQFWAQYGVKELPGSDGRIFGAGYKYSLSKRTTAYINYGNRNDAQAAFAGLAGSNQGVGIGLQHNF
jgi:predicted porin